MPSCCQHTFSGSLALHPGNQATIRNGASSSSLGFLQGEDKPEKLAILITTKPSLVHAPETLILEVSCIMQAAFPKAGLQSLYGPGIASTETRQESATCTSYRRGTPAIFMESCLCLASTSAFRGNVFDEFLDGKTLDISRTTFVAQSGREELSKSVSAKMFDTALSYAEDSGHHSSSIVSQMASCLRPGGVLKVSEPRVSNIFTPACSAVYLWRGLVIIHGLFIMQTGSSDTAAALRKALLLAGLSDIAVDSSSAGSRAMVSHCSP